MSKRVIVFLSFVVLTVSVLGEGKAKQRKIDFVKVIQPILEYNCESSLWRKRTPNDSASSFSSIFLKQRDLKKGGGFKVPKFRNPFFCT